VAGLVDDSHPPSSNLTQDLVPGGHRGPGVGNPLPLLFPIRG
jgi:hypothetical protein